MTKAYDVFWVRGVKVATTKRAVLGEAELDRRIPHRALIQEDASGTRHWDVFDRPPKVA